MTPFKVVKCFVDNNGHRCVYWQFNKLINYNPAAELYVEYAVTGSQWQKISDNIIGQCMFVDIYKTNYAKIDEGYYRLHMKVSNDEQYWSEPCGVGKRLNHRDNAKAQNFTRVVFKEAMLTGMPGMLLKKKSYGEPCPHCKHFSDDVSVNEHCETCLGTGITGGYYDGIPMPIIVNDNKQNMVVDSTGLAHSITMTARVPAWCYIEINDVWVDSETNRRYSVSGIDILSSFKHVPMVYGLKLELITETHVMHTENADVKADPKTPNVDWLEEFKVL